MSKYKLITIRGSRDSLTAAAALGVGHNRFAVEYEI
jgi:hypothetical protein